MPRCVMGEEVPLYELHQARLNERTVKEEEKKDLSCCRVRAWKAHTCVCIVCTIVSLLFCLCFCFLVVVVVWGECLFVFLFLSFLGGDGDISFCK